jgi:hypothetical protein
MAQNYAKQEISRKQAANKAKGVSETWIWPIPERNPEKANESGSTVCT